jgi:GDPmannose 4,6-dehydratase
LCLSVVVGEPGNARPLGHREDEVSAAGTEARASSRVALITGVSGQDGWYLSQLLQKRGDRVIGTVLEEMPATSGASGSTSAGERETLDVADADRVAELLARTQPDEIYHLAAQSHVGASWENAVDTIRANALGTACLLDAVRRIVPNARVVVAGSCEIFGRALETPQRETTTPNPVSPYGASKLLAQQLTAMFRERYAVHASTAILFNHESPRRPAAFVTQKIALGAAAVAEGRASELVLGNLESRRDWGFAADYVDAMSRMLQLDAPEDLVIGTGESRSVRDFCQAAFQHVGLDYREVVRVDPALFRPIDAPALVADAARARARLGWTPSISFEQLVGMMVDAGLERGAGRRHLTS